MQTSATDSSGARFRKLPAWTAVCAVLTLLALAGCPQRYAGVPDDAVEGTEQSYISDKPVAVAFRNPSPYPNLTLEEFNQLNEQEDFTNRPHELAESSLSEQFELEGFTWKEMRGVDARIRVPEAWSTVGLSALRQQDAVYRMRSHPEGQLEQGVQLEVYGVEQADQEALTQGLMESYEDDPNARRLPYQSKPAFLGDMAYSIVETVALDEGERVYVREYLLSDSSYTYRFTTSTKDLDRRSDWRNLFDYITHSLTRGYRSPDLPWEVNWEAEVEQQGALLSIPAREKPLSFGETALPSQLIVHQNHEWVLLVPDYQAGPDGEPVAEVSFPDEDDQPVEVEFGWPVNLEPELFYPKLRIWSYQAEKDQSSPGVLSDWVDRMRQREDFLEADENAEGEWVQFANPDRGLSEETRMLSRTVLTEDPDNPHDPTVHRLYAVVKGPYVYRIELQEKPQGHPRLKKFLQQMVRSFTFYGRARSYRDDSAESQRDNQVEELGIDTQF